MSRQRNGELVVLIPSLLSRCLAALKSPHGRRLLDGLHNAFLRLATSGTTLLIGIYIARLLGAEPFGSYVSLMAIAGMVATATSIGLPTVLARELATSRGDGDTRAMRPLVQALFLSNVVLMLLVIGTFVFGFVDIGFVLLFALAGNALATVMHLFIGHEKVLITNWIGGALRPVFTLAVLFILATATEVSVQSAILAQAAGALIAAFLLLMFWRGDNLLEAARRAVAPSRLAEHRRVFGMGITFSGSQLLIGAMTQVDILILTVLREPTEVGHYYAAARAALVVSLFFGSVYKLTEPTLARLHASGDVQETRRVVRSTAITGFGMAVAAALAASVLGPFYLRLYGDSFSDALPSLLIMMVGLLGLAATGPSQSMLRATRADGRLLVLAGISVAVGAGLTVALVPAIGITGAAIGTSVQFVLFGFLLAQAAKRASGTSTYVWSALRA
jgi:O-antigen/teichoic acid export membrane protein